MLDAVEEGEMDADGFIPRKALSSAEGCWTPIGGVSRPASDFCDFLDGVGLRVRAILKPWRNMAESGLEDAVEFLVGMSRVYMCGSDPLVRMRQKPQINALEIRNDGRQSYHSQ